MEFRIRLTYDRDTLTYAALQMARRSVSPINIGVYVLFVVVLVYLVIHGDPPTVVASAFTGVVFLTASAISFFVGRYRSVVRAFNRSPDKTTEFVFSENVLSQRTALGYHEHPWNVIRTVWRTRRAWLLVGPGGGYWALPIAQLDEGTRNFILEQVSKHGGRVT